MSIFPFLDVHPIKVSFSEFGLSVESQIGENRQGEYGVDWSYMRGRSSAMRVAGPYALYSVERDEGDGFGKRKYYFIVDTRTQEIGLINPVEDRQIGTHPGSDG